MKFKDHVNNHHFELDELETCITSGIKITNASCCVADTLGLCEGGKNPYMQ